MRVRAIAAALLFFASAASARVISYSPYSDRISYVATQRRTNRFFAIVEVVPPSQSPLSPYFGFPTGQLVIYDSKGESEPRVVLPREGTVAAFSAAAVREENGVSTILVNTNENFEGKNEARTSIWLFSADSGATWKRVALPENFPVQNLVSFQNDIGGPFANGRSSPIRIGTKSVPFVVQVSNGTISNVAADGTVKTLVAANNPQLVGTNADG